MGKGTFKVIDISCRPLWDKSRYILVLGSQSKVRCLFQVDEQLRRVVNCDV